LAFLSFVALQGVGYQLITEGYQIGIVLIGIFPAFWDLWETREGSGTADSLEWQLDIALFFCDL
jgi:hypothetical protein